MRPSRTDYLAAFALVAMCGSWSLAAEAPFAWQRDYARVSETGDIEWTPRAFRFEPSGSVRYIDYEHGSDAADGTSKDRPWKHHPWDAAATGKAAAAMPRSSSAA